jgi:hypothetical protein
VLWTQLISGSSTLEAQGDAISPCQSRIVGGSSSLDARSLDITAIIGTTCGVRILPCVARYVGTCSRRTSDWVVYGCVNSESRLACFGPWDETNRCSKTRRYLARRLVGVCRLCHHLAVLLSLADLLMMVLSQSSRESGEDPKRRRWYMNKAQEA